MERRTVAPRTSSQHEPIGPGDPHAQRRMHVRQMLGVVAITLLLAAIFNADALVRDTEDRPYGTSRDVWLGVWQPFQFVGDVFLLDRPRAAVDVLTGRSEDSPANFDFPSVSRGAEASAPEPPLPGFGAATPTVLPPSPTPEPTVRPPSAAEPLRLWVGGDSLAGIFGQSLVRMSQDTGLISATLEYQIATGLSRPDYFNWPSELQSISDKQNPDVFVVVFGSNDSQGLQNPAGEVYQPLSDGWRAEYRRRVAGTMDLISRPGRLIVWVGLPPMRDSGFSSRLADIDRIYREESVAREDVIYVDATALLGENGNYTAYLPDGSGHVEQVREPDGVHLTRSGGDRLAREVLRLLGEEVRLTPLTVSTP